jgi:hypothetical protein
VGWKLLDKINIIFEKVGQSPEIPMEWVEWLCDSEFEEVGLP